MPPSRRGGAPGSREVCTLSRAVASAAALIACCAGHAFGQENASSSNAGGQADLAAAAQNPIAAMVSLPFENNTFFRTGPDNDTANVLNIQPVIPFNLGDWNVITRTIIPVIYLPSVTDSLPDLPNADTSGDNFGLGDINFSAYFSPVSKGIFTWGIGPSLTLRTATSDRLGTQKWSAGPAAVALVTAKPWVAGTLVRQLWSSPARMTATTSARRWSSPSSTTTWRTAGTWCPRRS